MIPQLVTYFCLCAGIASAQVTVTGSRQPVEVMRAVFGAELKRTALYQVVMCNDGGGTVDLSGGLAVQVMQSHVSTIDGSLVPAFAARARKRSKLWQAAKIAEYGGLAGAIVFSGGVVAAPPAYAVGSALIGAASERLQSVVAQEQAVTAALLPRFLSAEETIRLNSRACASRLALGEYDRRISRFSGAVEGEPVRQAAFVRPSWARQKVEFAPAIYAHR